jgi:prolyl-tRNA editing enzyme YbaK/EbsC (Cys-tRNA(Pro) deacylase)
MLEDFIEYNKSNSKIFTFPAILSMDKAIMTKKVPPSKAVKLQIFNNQKNEPIIAVSPFHSELDIQKLSNLLGEELIELNNDEAIEITGYKKNFLPLISIFGIKFILDSSLERKDKLYCRVSEKNFLESPMEEILEYNEDIEFENIIKSKSN